MNWGSGWLRQVDRRGTRSCRRRIRAGKSILKFQRMPSVQVRVEVWRGDRVVTVEGVLGSLGVGVVRFWRELEIRSWKVVSRAWDSESIWTFMGRGALERILMHSRHFRMILGSFVSERILKISIGMPILRIL